MSSEQDRKLDSTEPGDTELGRLILECVREGRPLEEIVVQHPQYSVQLVSAACLHFITRLETKDWHELTQKERDGMARFLAALDSEGSEDL